MGSTMNSISHCMKGLCCALDNKKDGYSDEKAPLLDREDAITRQPSLVEGTPMSYHPARGEVTAANIVKALVNPSTLSKSQRSSVLVIEREVTAYGGWDEWLAEAVLNKLIDLVKDGDTDSWGDTFKKAVDEAKKVAGEVFEWAEDHPLLATAVVCVVVIGVLALTCPWALEMLGFGEIGIVEG
ncbi:hypothetical protein MMC10_011300 [Thelotrema lepadinum]|nr:hypothetical protein [Thelotrema lepadinum]